jgi:hypothetical protein
MKFQAPRDVSRDMTLCRCVQVRTQKGDYRAAAPLKHPKTEI